MMSQASLLVSSGVSALRNASSSFWSTRASPDESSCWNLRSRTVSAAEVRRGRGASASILKKACVAQGAEANAVPGTNESPTSEQWRYCVLTVCGGHLAPFMIFLSSSFIFSLIRRSTAFSAAFVFSCASILSCCEAVTRFGSGWHVMGSL
jgi:hypothetical protein